MDQEATSRSAPRPTPRSAERSLMLAIDQGTSSSRAVVVDHTGAIVGQGQLDFESSFPHDGWVEQDPEVLWDTTVTGVRLALADAGVGAAELSGLGITNQRETTLLWDRSSGRCLYPAIVWQDGRTADRCALLRAEGHGELIRQTTGLVIDPYFSATKLSWLLDNVAGARQQAEAGDLCFGTVDSFLLYRLTGGQVHLTDATNASRTQLYDLKAQDWSEAMLELHNIPRSLLPQVRDCVSDFGATEASLFGASIPIYGVAGDQQAALIGQNCLTDGMTKSTYGTGCFLITNTGDQLRESGSRLLGTVAYRLDGKSTFALEGSIFVAGVAVKWLRDQLGLIQDAKDTETCARATNGDTGGVYVVPAFTGLGAPHWQPAARGLVSGLTLDSSREQIVTATLASVAYQTEALAQALAGDGCAISELRVDGGMVGNSWLCQFLADVLDVNVDRPRVIETTALGAAMLAGVGAGVFSSLVEAGECCVHSDQRFVASMADDERGRLLAGWDEAVARVLYSPPTEP